MTDFEEPSSDDPPRRKRPRRRQMVFRALQQANASYAAAAFLIAVGHLVLLRGVDFKGLLFCIGIPLLARKPTPSGQTSASWPG